MEDANAPDTTAQEMSFMGKLNDMRAQIKRLAKYVNDTKESHANDESDGIENRGEVMANITLAYRHLEDASMRIGKTIQAKDGGVSVYDKNTTVGA